jgi:LmbE family N-acetylglucosaminyl deacetylase
VSVRPGYAEMAAWYRRALVATARDITDTSAGARTLVLAPHPDDETVGCGATLARKCAEGSAVHVCVVTDGSKSQRSDRLGARELAIRREREARRACEVLGIDERNLRFLAREDSSLAASDDRLVEGLASMIDDLRPRELLVPCGIDVHPDHRAVYRAGLDAHLRATSDAVVLAYPVHFWRPSAWADPGASPRRRAVQRIARPLVSLPRLRPRAVRTGPFLDVKRRALDAYRDEFQSYTWISGETFLAAYLTPEELFFEIDPTGAPLAGWQ